MSCHCHQTVLNQAPTGPMEKVFGGDWGVRRHKGRSHAVGLLPTPHGRAISAVGGSQTSSGLAIHSWRGEKFPNTGIVSTARKMSPLASQHRRRRTHGARGAAQLCRHGVQHCLWGACGSGSITARHSVFRPGYGPGLPHCIGDAWCWRCSKGTHTRRGHRTGRCGVGEFGGGRRR